MVDFDASVSILAGRYCRRGAFLPGASTVCVSNVGVGLELLGNLEPIDGVIAAVPGPDPAHQATRFGKPVVNVSSLALPGQFPTVTTDNIAIGRMAADHLLLQGYRHFACHMESRIYFSRQRLTGFRQRLEEAGRTCDVFDTAPTDGQGADANAMRRDATCRWLRGLSHPAGLFTHGDLRAVALMELCRDLGLSVPEQVGILGTDNDELVAAYSAPPLSSIDLAPEVVGYHAAELLGGLLSGGGRSQRGEANPSARHCAAAIHASDAD